MLTMSFAGQASARILFQDDTFHDVASEGLNINSDDAGVENVTLQFGNDGTDGTVVWNDTLSELIIGDGIDNVSVNSASWDISSAGVASGFTGFTSTGVVDFSGTSRMALDQGAANPATCTEGDIHYNTTDNLTYVCTALNTWTALSAGGADTFESVYAADADKVLTTSNGIFTIEAGTGAVNVNSTTGGVSLNNNVNGAVNLATGTSTGLVSIGGGSGTAAVNTTSWDISSAGVASGFTGFTTGGTVSLGDNSGTVTINSSDWDVSATGDMTGIGAITADGLLTGTAGATLSGAAINLNNNSNFAVNVGTGTSTGAVTVGGGSNTVAVNSSSWDISTAGAASGFTTFSGSGNITTSGGDFIIGTTGLTETTAANDSGAFLVGAFDEFDNTANTNVQAILNDFDLLIGVNAPNVDTMNFEPEFPNYAVYEDGTANKGKLEVLYDNTNREHYYRWTTKQLASNDVDVRFRYALPADYAAAGNMTLRLRTDTIVAGDNSINVTVRNDTDNATCHADGSTTGAVAGTWETITITGAEIETGCTAASALNPGDIIEVQLKFAADNTSSGGTDVGTLTFAYTN